MSERTQKPRSPDWLNWFYRIAIGLVLLTGVILVGVRLTTGSDWARRLVETRIESMNFRGQTVELDGLTGNLLSSIKIDRLVLKDADGTWLTARNIKIDWAAAPILKRELQLDLIKAERLELLRTPHLAAAKTTADSGASLRAIAIDDVQVEAFYLAKGLAPYDLTAKLDGAFERSEIISQGRLHFTSSAAIADQLELDFSWPSGGQLTGTYSLEGGPGGLLATYLRLDPNQSIRGHGLMSRFSSGRFVGTGEVHVDNAPLLTFETVGEGQGLLVRGQVQPGAHPLGSNYEELIGKEVDFAITMSSRKLADGLSLTVTAPLLELAAQTSNLTDWTGDMRLEDPHRWIQRKGLVISQIEYAGRVSVGAQRAVDGQLAIFGIRDQSMAVQAVRGPLNIQLQDGLVSGLVDLKIEGLNTGGDDKAVRDVTVKANGHYGLSSGVLALGNFDVLLPEGKLTGSGQVATGDEFGAELTGIAFPRAGLVAGAKIGPQGLPWTIAISPEDSGGIRSDLSVTADEIALETVEASGVELSATLTMADGVVEGRGLLKMRKLLGSGQSLTTVGLDIGAFSYRDGQASVQTNLSANLLDQEVSGSFDLSFDRERLAADNFALEWGGLVANGEMIVPLAHVARAQGWVELDGRLDAYVPAERVQSRLTISDGDIGGFVKLAHLEAGALNLEVARFGLSGNPQVLRVETHLIGKLHGGEFDQGVAFDGPLVLYDLASADRSVEISGIGRVGDLDLSMPDPVRLSRSTEFGWIGEGTIHLKDGSLELVASPAKTQRLSLIGKNISIAPLLEITGQSPRDGRLDFNLAFDQADTAILTGGGQLVLSGVQGLDEDEGGIAILSELRLDDRGVLINPLETQHAGLAIDGEVLLPYTVSGQSFLLDRLEDVVPTFQVSAAGEIQHLAGLYLPPDLLFSGEVELDLEGELQGDTPIVHGVMTMQAGRFEHGELGLNLRNLNVSTRFEKQTIIIDELSGEGVSGGSIRGGGDIALGDLSGSASQVTLERLVVLDRQEGRAVANGKLELALRDQRPTVTGELEIVDGEVNLEKLPKSGPPTLDVDFNGNGAEVIEPKQRGVLGLDVALRSTRGISLVGRGIDAQLGLEIHLGGTVLNPSISGQAQVVRGRFDLLGKRFEFGDSSVELVSPTGQSRLNITANRQADGFTYTIKIGGTADRPDVELSSDPHLPEDEVLSQVLFARAPSQLSALEAARLAAALAQLNGGGGFDLMGGLEQELGLDRLSFETDEDNTNTLTTGKYLSDDVYVEVQTSATGSSGITIEWQPLENIEIEAQTVPDEGQTLSVRWKKDFD